MFLNLNRGRRVGLAIAIHHDLDLGPSRQPRQQDKQDTHKQPFAQSHYYLPEVDKNRALFFQISSPEEPASRRLAGEQPRQYLRFEQINRKNQHASPEKLDLSRVLRCGRSLVRK